MKSRAEEANAGSERSVRRQSSEPPATDYIQRHTKAAAPAGRGCAAPRAEKTLQTDGPAPKARGRPSSPGPSEALGAHGGVVGARLAAASSRRIPEPVATDAEAGMPVLTARTGAPLGEGRWRDSPAARARARSPQRSRRRSLRGLTQRCSAGGRRRRGPRTPASASRSAPQPPPSAAPRNVLPAGDLFRPAAAAAVAAAAPSSRPRGRGSDCGDKGGGGRCHRRRCRSCS